ncbi:hypothetical protein MPH47_20535 [Psychrobacillus psychrodurans]|nr:hypothetical protein [Psychrobacillus psychrodurans]MCK1999581.1 hypothetical protein [Psychrobacillus psychrodurans]
MKHTREDLDRFIDFLHDMDGMTGQMAIEFLKTQVITILLLFNAWRSMRFYISFSILLFLIKRRDPVYDR